MGSDTDEAPRREVMKLPGGKEGSFLVEREQFFGGKKDSFPVGREKASGGKACIEASRWEVLKLSGGK